MKPIPSDRISLTEMVRTIKPLMSKSTFYGTRSAPGPRWTEVERLDIRNGRNRITADRQRFNRWFREQQGALADTPHSTSTRLGANARRTNSDVAYGEQLANLCRALDKGVITQDQFDRALNTLPSPV